MGYRFATNQSTKAIKWLCHVEEELGITIQHVGCGPEVLITGAGRVDGVYENTVFEFDGCWYHGCDAPGCFPVQFSTVYDTERNEEMRIRRSKTKDKHNAIKAAGYNLIVMKECDFDRKLFREPDLDRKLSQHQMIAVTPLNPRDAFYGGRTNASTLYFKSDGHTKMHYMDVMSLYPWANKYCPNVVGHPKVHIGDECTKVSWQNLNGLIKATVLPPKGLDFPVLPTRMHNKLMFVLCNTCALNLSKGYCDHNDEYRKIEGTWVIGEVKLALSKGYQILNVHEIWEYETVQYDPISRTGGLFTEYINAFLKIKAEASGWPKSCKTAEEKQAYIDGFYEREGVHLDAEKIEYNPSLRQLAKTQLNSF